MINLTRTQFFLILFVVQSGTIFISFQNRLIKSAGTDAWLLFIGAGLLHYMILLFYERYYKKFNPRPLVLWLYKLYWLLIIVTFISYTSFTLATWTFPKTPQVVIVAVIVGVSLYVNLSKVETVINLSVMLVPLIPLFFLSLFLGLPNFDWTNLFPVGHLHGTKIFLGILASQSAFIGVDVYLFLRKHVIKENKIKGFPLFIYQNIWFIFFFTTLLIVLMYFTVEEIKILPEPIIFMLKAQQVSFIERVDLIFIYIWMLWSIITICLFVFMIIQVHHQNKKEGMKRNTIILHIVLIIVPLFFISKEKVNFIRNSLLYIQILFIFLIPIAVILFDRRKQK